MARWVRAHRKEIDRANTYFVNLDSMSFGNVHYLAGEGAVLNHPTDRRLFELCEAVADATDPDARPIRIPLHTDALPLLARGFRAISLIGATDGVGAPYYHTPEDTPDRVDQDSMEQGRRLHRRPRARHRPRRHPHRRPRLGRRPRARAGISDP